MNHEDWGEGPWNHEDDHDVWVDPVSNLDCMINRGPSGALCGYVGVPPTHPWHSLRYDDVDVAVHGGLTYSAACQEGGEICHLPEEGREADIWWFGFDCAHAFDISPKMEMEMRVLAEKLGDPRLIIPVGEGPLSKVYRDWEYVTNEVTQLAWQLVQVRS